jgi:hypothetical protein
MDGDDILLQQQDEEGKAEVDDLWMGEGQTYRGKVCSPENAYSSLIGHRRWDKRSSVWQGC